MAPHQAQGGSSWQAGPPFEAQGHGAMEPQQAYMQAPTHGPRVMAGSQPIFGPQPMAGQQGMFGPDLMAGNRPMFDPQPMEAGRGCGCDHGAGRGPGHPNHDGHQHQVGQWMELVNDLTNGNPDPSRLLSCLGSLDTQFWKGALVGVAVAVLLTDNSLKNSILGLFRGSSTEV